MTTGRQIVKDALQKAGVTTKNEDPDADEISDGLRALNAMLDSWSNDSLTAFVRPKESFPLSAGVAAYTIGSGGTFDTVRPLQIISASVRITGSTDYPLDPLGDKSYDDLIHQKDTQSLPAYYQYDAGNPLGTITLYPVPAEAYTLFIRSEKPLASVALDTDIALPPGWDRALVYNLAVEISPEYGVGVPTSVDRIAAKSYEKIKKAAFRNRDWVSPQSRGSGGFNVRTGRWA